VKSLFPVGADVFECVSCVKEASGVIETDIEIAVSLLASHEDWELGRSDIESTDILPLDLMEAQRKITGSHVAKRLDKQGGEPILVAVTILTLLVR